MKVEYKHKKLGKMLLDPKRRHKVFGERARKIDQRLSELNAVSCLEQLRKLLPNANCHELAGNKAGKFAVDISQNFRMIFEPATNPPPRKADGGLDWSGIISIRILAIEDYH